MSTVPNNMMDNIFNSDSKDFDEPPFHLITTDHPYMATLGLTHFTTGTLYRWWVKQNAAGELVNQKHFFDVNSSNAPTPILIGNDATNGIGVSQFSFFAWRKQNDAGAGKYVKKFANDGHNDLWDFFSPGLNEKGDPRAYSYDDLQMSELKDGYYIPNGVGIDFKSEDFTIPDGKGGQKSVSFTAISPITELVNLNDYVNNKANNSRTLWDKTDFARNELITDIRTAKAFMGGMGYVEWSGLVPFRITIPGTGARNVFECNKADWVKYKLYLYPSEMPKSSRRTVTMAKPIFAAPPVDALGRKYQFKEDGRFSAFPEGSKAAQVAGELDMTFNEYTGKWEAGSKQMVAVITQDTPPAQVVKASVLRNLPTEQMLANPTDPSSHIIWGSGLAMPLNMQNGNPMQWTPNYAQSSTVDSNGKLVVDCPDESTAKAEVRIFNASAKKYLTNQYVLLNQIDGLWFAIDFPSGIEGADVQAGFDGKWQFSYFATNFVHYFRDISFNSIDSHWIEQSFHRAYYNSDVLNKDYYSPIILKDKNNNDYEWSIRNIFGGAYHQFTSFDFLDEKIAGTRTGVKGNALGITNPLIDPANNNIEDENDGQKTGAFFGCIFPDGYNTEQIAKYKIDRNYDVEPIIAVSGLTNDGWKFNQETAAIESNNYIYFKPGGLTNKVKPFNDGLIRHDPTDGHSEGNIPSTMFDDRDAALTHLPADIATNAAPSGLNGTPIINYNFLDRVYLSPRIQMPSYALEYFKYGLNWLHKKPTDPNSITADYHKNMMSNSAFDFKPNVPNRIMFRPLKAELYASLIDPNIPIDTTQRPKGTREFFSQSIARKMSSQKPPVSLTARNRELESSIWFTDRYHQTSLIIPGMNGRIYNLYNTHWGLQLNIDIPSNLVSEGFILNNPTQYKISPYAAFSVGNDTSRFHHDAWGFETNFWCHGGIKSNQFNSNYHLGTDPPWRAAVGGNLPMRPAGGIGIIGAVATCTANDTIKFQTNNQLGCWSWAYIRNNPLESSNVSQNPSWGKQNGYRDLNTTNLWVKIYQQWPRSQTIYDPRYFAVHHFNPGVYDNYTGDTVNIVPEIKKITKNIKQNNQTYKYAVDVSSTEVDLRIPTMLLKNPDQSPSINTPQSIPENTHIYGSIVILSPNEIRDLMPEKNDWNIDAKRRAKLLPYKYEFLTINIPKVKVLLPLHDSTTYENGGYAIRQTGNTNNGFLTTDSIPFYDLQSRQTREFNPIANNNEDIVMIVKNPGIDYRVGDIFTISDKTGADLIITVKAIEADGRIKEFEVTNPGYDFNPASFAKITLTNPKITKSTSGLQVVKASSSAASPGKDFILHLIRGVISKLILTDEKPKLATNPALSLISIKSNAGAVKQSPDPFGLDTGNFELDMKIVNQSFNKKYDLFFHFHNDISHTFKGDLKSGQDDWSGTVGRWNNDEQYIDLIVTTT